MLNLSATQPRKPCDALLHAATLRMPRTGPYALLNNCAGGNASETPKLDDAKPEKEDPEIEVRPEEWIPYSPVQEILLHSIRIVHTCHTVSEQCRNHLQEGSDEDEDVGEDALEGGDSGANPAPQ